MSRKRTPKAIELRKAPKQSRSRQTYQVILQGADRIIRRDGIQKLSTNRVAEESGVSIGSLYQYFPSKEAIVAALIDQVFEVEYQHMKLRIESISPELGPLQWLKEILGHCFYRKQEDLVFRKALIDLMEAVGKVPQALRFYRQLSELIWLNLHLKFKGSTTPAISCETTIFFLTYLMSSLAHSSVDENINSINKELLIDEIAGVWLNLMKIQNTK